MHDPAYHLRCGRDVLVVRLAHDAYASNTMRFSRSLCKASCKDKIWSDLWDRGRLIPVSYVGPYRAGMQLCEVAAISNEAARIERINMWERR